MTSSSIHNGDIVLVTFPFTNLAGSKLRPAVVISSDEVHREEEDLTLLFVSSVISDPLQSYELLFRTEHPDFSKSGLKKDSIFKANKIATIQKKLVKRKLGMLGSQIREELEKTFKKAVTLQQG